jgi:eukaryotic-like serine/threonine-protein kinase
LYGQWIFATDPSARNASFFGLLGALLGIATGGLFGGLIGGMLVGLGVGLCSGLVFSFPAGGSFCIQHILVRMILRHYDYAPWNYPGFLDYVAERIFVRKVGGGYIFVHRMLMEYFAGQYLAGRSS